MDIVKIAKPLRLVATCWKVAEANLQTYIAANCVNKGEEFITETFHGKFAEVIREASDKHYITKAFLDDPKDGLRRVEESDLRKIASGIVAEATKRIDAARQPSYFLPGYAWHIKVKPVPIGQPLGSVPDA
jgi:hypothetical protein